MSILKVVKKYTDYGFSVEKTREQFHTNISLEETQPAVVKVSGPNDEGKPDSVEETYLTPKKIPVASPNTFSPYYQPSYQTGPGSEQNGGRFQGSNVDENNPWDRLWATLKRSPFKQSDNRITQADSNKKSLVGPQNTSSRFNARTSISVSQQSPANPLTSPGVEHDWCASKNPSMQSQTGSGDRGTSVSLSSILSTLSNSLSSSKQQAATQKPDVICYPTSQPSHPNSSMSSNQRNTSSALDQYQNDLKRNADHCSSTSNQSGYVSRNPHNEKNIFDISKKSTMANAPPAAMERYCWYCGWCKHGPHSLLSPSCLSCNRPKDNYSYQIRNPEN